MDSSIKLYFLKFKTSLKGFWDYIRTVFRFYSYTEFRKADLALLKSYIGVNPYRLSRKFLEESKAKEIYAYGETPLISLEKIVNACGIKSKDTVYELGCGRGRTCFWLALVLKAKVVGIDFVPKFIEKAQEIGKRVPHLKFRSENFLKSDLHKATVIYLHGSCMEDADIERLNFKLIRLKKGLKVITVSFALSDYDVEGNWEVLKVFPAEFSWGTADVYLQKLVKCSA